MPSVAISAPSADRLVLGFDLTATFVFGLEGASSGVDANLDLLGVLVIGFITALATRSRPNRLIAAGSALGGVRILTLASQVSRVRHLLVTFGIARVVPSQPPVPCGGRPSRSSP